MWECRSRSGTTSTMRERRKSDANTTSDTIWRKRTRMGRGPHLPVVTPPLLRPHVGELTKKQHVRFLVPCASRWARTDAPDRASGSGTGRGRRDISGAVRTGVGVVSGLLPQGTRQPKHQHRASGSGAGCGRRGVFGRRAGTGGGMGGFKGWLERARINRDTSTGQADPVLAADDAASFGAMCFRR